MNILIRDVCGSDIASVLGLNETYVEFLSPLDLAGLEALAEEAAYFRIVKMAGEVVAFLIAFTPGASYDSINYRWFDGQFDDFVYVDRIVVAEKAQGRSLGVKLYDDLAKFARAQNLNQMTCEYNIEPMNEGSAKFHQRYGFNEIGQQTLPGGTKRVSFQSFALG